MKSGEARRISIHALSSRLQHFCTQVVRFVGFMILLFSLLACGICLIVFCIKHQDVFSIVEILWCIPAGVLFILIIGMARIMQTQKEAVVSLSMIALGSCLAAIMIVSYDTQPCSDYSQIWKNANEIAEGVFTGGTTPNHYMYYYNWQIGITVFESILIKLGLDFFGLKIFNAILILASQYTVYRLVKRKLGFRTACIAYSLSTLHLPWILTIPQFTNHHIGIVFLMLALYWIEQHTFLSWTCAGVTLAVMNLLRPLGVIVLLAAACYTIYRAAHTRSFLPLLLLFSLVLSYLIVITAFDHAFISAGYTDAKVSQARIPYFKFQKGLYPYIEPYSDLSAFNFNYSEYNAAMKEELIRHITTNPLQTAIYIANKMVRYLGLFDYQFEMTYNHDVSFYTQYPVRALYCTSWFQYIGILFFALIGYRRYLKLYSVDIYQIFFIGNTLVYFLIEAFSSYRFESYPFLLTLASLGIEAFFSNNSLLFSPKKLD